MLKCWNLFVSNFVMGMLFGGKYLLSTIERENEELLFVQCYFWAMFFKVVNSLTINNI